MQRDVERGLVIITFRGGLTLATAPLAHTTVRKCLAEQPLALLIDISEMSGRSNVAVPVFLAMRQLARRPPAVPIIVVASRIGIGSSLRAALNRHLPTCVSLDEARGVAARLPAAGRWLHLRLEPSPLAPSIARNRVSEACAEWRLVRMMHPARLVASELVSNAVEHAAGLVGLTVALRGRFLCLAVRDGSPVLPHLLEPVPHDPGAPLDIRGYGLRMLAHAAHSWGAEATTDGKVVWATLRVDDRARDPVRGPLVSP